MGVEPLTAGGFAAAVITAVIAWWRDMKRQGDTSLDLASNIALNLADRLQGEALTYKQELHDLRAEFQAYRHKADAEFVLISERMKKCEEDRALLLEMAQDAGKDTSSFN